MRGIEEEGGSRAPSGTRGQLGGRRGAAGTAMGGPAVPGSSNASTSRVMGQGSMLAAGVHGDGSKARQEGRGRSTGAATARAGSAQAGGSRQGGAAAAGAEPPDVVDLTLDNDDDGSAAPVSLTGESTLCLSV